MTKALKLSKSWTIFGCGDFIYDIADVIQANNQIIKRIVLNIPIKSMLRDNLPAKLEKFSDFVPTNDENYFFGFINPDKEVFLKQISHLNIKFSNLIHPTSYVARGAKLGEGNFIGAGVIIGPESTIGNYNYINRKVSLGHNVVVGDFNHFAPGVNICGKCKIGSKNLFGASSTVIDGLRVGSNIKLGAGGVATTNLKSSLVYIGSPAKPKK